MVEEEHATNGKTESSGIGNKLREKGRSYICIPQSPMLRDICPRIYYVLLRLSSPRVPDDEVRRIESAAPALAPGVPVGDLYDTPT